VIVYFSDYVSCIDCNIVEVLLKMSRFYTNIEYADMMYVYGFCDGNARAALDEYRRRYPTRRIPYARLFSKVFHTLRESGMFVSVHSSFGRPCQQNVKEEEKIIEIVQRNPTISIRKIAAQLGVPKSRVWRTIQQLREDNQELFEDVCNISLTSNIATVHSISEIVRNKTFVNIFA